MYRTPFKKSMNSAYVSFDGPEFVGKTTFVKHLSDYLTQKNENFVIVREPGQTMTGQLIREKIFKREIPPLEAIDYFMADRILTQQLVVKPALMKNGLVFSDRSVISSYVYQGFYGNESVAVIEKHEHLVEFLYPQLVIVPTCPLDVCLARFKERYHEDNNINYNDTKERQFHEKIHHIFSEIDQWCPDGCQYAFVDFNRPLEQILPEVLKLLADRLNIHI